jgi:hypothetical protein
MVGGVGAQPSQPAVIVASTMQSSVMQVLQISVVETTAAQPETEAIETDVMPWPRARAALGAVSYKHRRAR